MSYESALQRVGELRAAAGLDPAYGSTAASTATTDAFQAQLSQQQSLLAGAGAGGSDDPMSQFGLPVLSVADQYRMLGITPLTASGPGSGAGARMVALAQQEIGVGETSGNNESPRIREYRTATAGAEGTPGPWCAYFVSWLAKSAGAPIGAGGNGTGYVPTLEAWGRQEGRFAEAGSYRPSPGDVVIFDWGGDGVADHTGIVESVDADGTVHTIEGNASDVVKRREYAASTNDIKGYVRM
jgi:uncharacterized protein (TIGR02594 family)